MTEPFLVIIVVLAITGFVGFLFGYFVLGRTR